MTIYPEGLGLSLIVFAIVAAQIVTHKWVRKVTNCYFFWLGVGLLVCGWLIGFRFAEAWQRYAIEHTRPNFDPTEYGDAFVLSKAFLLDICPAMGLLLPFSMIVDPTRKSSRAIAPLAFIGGLFIILLDIPTSSEAEFTWEYIFFGVGDNTCYFILHALNLILAVGIMLNTPGYGWKGYLVSVGTAILFYSYVGIMMATTKVSWFVSGLHLNDWSPLGEYHQVAEVLGWDPLPTACVGLPFMFCVTSGFIALNDYVFKKGWWAYGNVRGKHWYCWYNYRKFKTQLV